MNTNETDKIKSFKDLNAWKEAHKLVIQIYKITSSFPQVEQFALVNQLRRAVVSITSNIAEGFSRASFKEKIQFYSMSLGSLTEVENQILVAKDVGYINQEEFIALQNQIIICNKLMNGLIKKSRTLSIHTSYFKIHNSESGFITMLGALILMSVGLVVSVSVLLIGIGETKTALAIKQANQAIALANACSEEALQVVYTNAESGQLPPGLPYSNGLTLGAGTCNYTISQVSGNDLKITATGTVESTIRKNQVLLTVTLYSEGPPVVSASISVTSWQEVASF